ncbi:hypothetical protein [Bacillus sp. V5-8f]|uniref:hypothetical protein n=1 Tax=Bacillus sp. V5-8f TaxID=2053044 RepID=UPI0035B51C67
MVLFLLAGIAEIGGGYLIWLWLREGNLFLGMFGGVEFSFIRRNCHISNLLIIR